jgi:PEP-CTERM motif
MVSGIRSLAIASALAAACLLAPDVARADLVTFDLSGSCTYFCGSTGQNSGDPISGYVTFNNFDSAADGSYLVPSDYHLVFGNVVLTTGITDVFLHPGYDTLEKIDANTLGPGLFMVWSATENVPLIFLGNCYGCAANEWAYGFAPGSYGPFAFTRETPVPEPASAAILAASLAGIVAVRRRRQR